MQPTLSPTTSPTESPTLSPTLSPISRRRNLGSNDVDDNYDGAFTWAKGETSSRWNENGSGRWDGQWRSWDGKSSKTKSSKWGKGDDWWCGHDEWGGWEPTLSPTLSPTFERRKKNGRTNGNRDGIKNKKDDNRNNVRTRVTDANDASDGNEEEDDAFRWIIDDDDNNRANSRTLQHEVDPDVERSRKLNFLSNFHYVSTGTNNDWSGSVDDGGGIRWGKAGKGGKGGRWYDDGWWADDDGWNDDDGWGWNERSYEPICIQRQFKCKKKKKARGGWR